MAPPQYSQRPEASGVVVAPQKGHVRATLGAEAAAAADLRSIGVECAALVQTNTPLPASVVSVLYDCLYDFATVANAASDAVLMLFVQQDERRVQLRAMLGSSDAESERMAATFDELRASLEKHRVEYSIETDSSSASLVAYVPLSTKGGK